MVDITPFLRYGDKRYIHKKNQSGSASVSVKLSKILKDNSSTSDVASTIREYGQR